MNITREYNSGESFNTTGRGFLMIFASKNGILSKSLNLKGFSFETLLRKYKIPSFSINLLNRLLDKVSVISLDSFLNKISLDF